jgi:hypothetical protein
MWAGMVMLVRRRFIAGETAQVVKRLGTAIDFPSFEMVEQSLPNVNPLMRLTLNNLQAA